MRPKLRLRFLLRQAAAIAVCMAAVLAQGQSKPLAVQVGGPAGSVDLGGVPASQPMQLTLFLAPTPERTAALDQYLADLTTVGSANYHQWLTPQQFATRFGATTAQMDALAQWVQAQGFSLLASSPSGTSVTVAGSAAQVEAAFSAPLHRYAAGGAQAFAPARQPTLPVAIASVVAGVSGLDTLPVAGNLALTTLSPGGAATPLPAGDPLLTVAQAVDGNAAPILMFNTNLCAADVAASTQAVYGNLLRQANAQGITVPATTACSGAGSFPAGLAEVTAVGPEMGSKLVGIAPRPGWQSAPGLPDDADRHEPDFAANNLQALAATLASLMQGGSGRLGNVNSVLYSLAPTPGLFYQPDGEAAGTWEPSTGLGVIDLQKLVQVFPRGTGSSFASLSSSSYSINYGDSVTFTSNVTSGTGGATPTGTVTFTLQGGGTLCASSLVNGTATCTPTSALNGGSNSISASYSGNGTYAPASTPNVTVFVAGEQSHLAASVSTNNTYGGNFTVTVTDTGSSGVGVPTGTVTVTTPVNGNTFTGVLAQASANSAATTITVPASLVGTITLSISCTATQNFKCDNPATTTVTITKATPGLTFSYTPSNATSGQTVNLTATAAAVGTGAVPTGNVSFTDDSVVLNAATLVNGTASTAGILPTAATHSLSATYDGDANYLTANSGSSTTNNGSGATNTSVTATNFGPAYGTSTTITATVTAQNASGTPTGSVSFTDSLAGSLGSVPLTGSGAATLAVSTLAVGSHTISAAYVPTGGYTASTAPVPVTIAVVKATPTGTLAVSPNPPVSGASYTLTATLPATGATPPTGSILFQDSGNVLGTVAMASGVATFTGTLSSAATHGFTAAYTGDSNYNGTSLSNSTSSTSGTVTTTTLTPSSSAPAAGTAVTLTAHVSSTSGSPTGSVVFSDTVAGPLGNAVLASGAASVQVSTLAAGSHSITAAYGGDSTYAASTSPAVGVTVPAVTGVSTTVTLTISPAAPAIGDSVIFGAGVTPASVVNNTPPSGTVQFRSGSTVLCSGTLSNYFATCTSTTITAGTYSVTAVYAGDANYAAGSSTASPLTVAAGSGSGALTAALTAASAGYGNTDTVTASVASSSSTATVSGSIQAVVNGKIYTGTLSSGAGSVTFDVPPPGTYSVVVSCVAPLSCTGSPVTLPLTSTKGATTTTVVSSSSAPSAGASITLTATVAPTGNGTGPYTFSGTVAFLDGTATLGTAAVSGNQAVLTTTLYGAKTHNITAVYSGDANWFGSTSTAAGVLIAALPANVVLSSNVSSALAGVTINFNVTVSGPASVPLAPTGTVIFYDSFGGIVRSLGTATVVATGPYTSIAALPIGGLMAGTHNVSVAYSGDTNFATGTSNTVTLGLTDFSSMFVPMTQTVARGNSVQSSMLVTMIGGFSGQISLGCTPPPNTETTCGFSPAILTGNGTTTLTITTTPPQSAKNAGGGKMQLAGGAALALLLGFFIPGRRRVGSVLLILFAAVLTMNIGCAVSSSTIASPVKQSDPGSPLGTAMFNITVAGTDGVSTIRHNYQYQVTIQ